MKFLVYGDATTPGSGAWCYAETLEEMGHKVVRTSDDNLLEHYRNVAWRGVRKALGRPLECHRYRHTSALTQLVRTERPDIVIILKGLHVSRDDVKAMKSAGAWVVIINHDDFFSSTPRNWSSTPRRAISEYDFVFVTRQINVNEVRPLNSKVEFFQFAFFPRINR